MEATATVSPPRWYWIVSVVALLWMLFGVVALVMESALPCCGWHHTPGASAGSPEWRGPISFFAITVLVRRGSARPYF